MGECTIHLKRGQVKYRLITDNHCVYIHRIVWGLSFSVVIVCILWVSFFSGRLDGADHCCFSGMAEVGTILSLSCKLFIINYCEGT